jgi:hypothetical protein
VSSSFVVLAPAATNILSVLNICSFSRVICLSTEILFALLLMKVTLIFFSKIYKRAFCTDIGETFPSSGIKIEFVALELSIGSNPGISLGETSL